MMNDLNGCFSDKIHYYQARIHYADTDAAGIVYHSRYLDLAERARAAFLNLINVPEVINLEDTTYFWIIRKVQIDYKAPARIADIVLIQSHITALNKASLEVVQHITKEDKILVEIKLLLAFINEKGRVQKVLPEIRHKIVSYIQASKIEGNKHG